MPATSIQSPFPIFTDIDGQPLEAGLIWLGTAGNNPISSPITAYWDAALTQVVTQPVTTRGGYPLNGTAVGRLYVNANYSILVRNRSGSDVLSALNATERYDSSLVTFIQAGAGAVTRTAQAKMRDVVSVLDFGADSSGATSSVSAFNSALLSGGTIFVPPGIYKLDSKVSFTVNNTTLLLAANVTLQLSGVPATQIPFGNQLHIIADDCAVIGSGPSSVLQLTNGSQANAVGILHKKGLLISNLTIDGDQASVNGSGFTDDTFGSAVSIVSTTSGGASGDVNAIVENCIMKRFFHYGVNIYGAKANGVRVSNNIITDMGTNAWATSVGGGIVVTSAVSNFEAFGNIITGCKKDAIFCSSAGISGSIYSIFGNQCNNNGATGIKFSEENVFGSIAGQGLSQITVTGNVCNSNSSHGILFGTYTNTGFLKNISCTGNTCTSNTQYGILAQSNAAPNNVNNLVISGNSTSGNGSGGVAFTSNVANCSSSGNTNNDVPYYLEGTWTPFAARSSGGAITATYSTQLGKYVKIGNTVTVSGFVVISAVTSQGTGESWIGGLPFIPADNSLGAGSVGRNNAFTTDVVGACWGWSDQYLRFSSNVNSLSATAVNWKDGYVNFSYTYFI